MPTLTMSPTLGDLLKYELNANYCRETVTLKSGTNYALGSVLGKITASGKYRLSPAAQVVGDEGAETAVAVLIEAVDATRSRQDRPRGRARPRHRVQGGARFRRLCRPAGREGRQARPACRSRCRPARRRLIHRSHTPHAITGPRRNFRRGPNHLRRPHGPDDQSVRRGRLHARRDDHSHQHPAQHLYPARADGPVPLRGRDPAQRHHRAGRGRAQPPADGAARRAGNGRQPRHPLDALVHRAVDPA